MERSVRSSFAVSAPRCACVTSAQVSAASLSALLTRETSSFRTCGVRAHTPPVRLWVDPSTLWLALGFKRGVGEDGGHRARVGDRAFVQG